MLEALLGMSLLITGILAYIQLDTKLITHNRQVLQKTEATLLLQNKIELLAESGNTGETGTDTIVLNSHSYDLSWSIDNIPAGKTINIGIAWKDQEGKFSDQAHLELTGQYPRLDLLSLSLLPPATPIQP